MIEVKPETSNRKCYCCLSPYKVVSIEIKGEQYGNFVSICQKCALELVTKIDTVYKESFTDKK